MFTGSNVIAPNFPKQLLELSLYKKILPCDPEQMDYNHKAEFLMITN